MAGGQTRNAAWHARVAEQQREIALAASRPDKPGFCWVTVQLAGEEVQRPGVVARWLALPEGRFAVVAWSDGHGAVHTEHVPVERLAPVALERAPERGPTL